MESCLRLRANRLCSRCRVGPGSGEDAVCLRPRLGLQRLGAFGGGCERRRGFLLDARQACLRLALRLGHLLPLSGELLLRLLDLLVGGLEVTLEVIELRLALVEREPAKPDLFLGARQTILRRFLGVLLDAVGEFDGRPDQLQRLKPRRAVIRGEADRARTGVEAVRVRRQPLELRKGDDVGAGLRIVLELGLVPLHRIHGLVARVSQAWISQPR